MKTEFNGKVVKKKSAGTHYTGSSQTLLLSLIGQSPLFFLFFLSSPFIFIFIFIFLVFFLSSSLTVNTKKQLSSTLFFSLPFRHSHYRIFFLILSSLQILFLVGLWVEIGGFMGIVICFCYLIHITEKYVGIVILVLVMALSFYWA